ncbi:MAG: hypothetical protein ACE5ES_04425, partial [Candidatus Nanoarchaeia archaeon]
LFIDSLTFKIQGRSLVSNNLDKLIGMFIISPVIWFTYEFFNIALQKWYYIGTEPLGVFTNLYSFVAFSTMLPAVFVTYELVKALFKFKEKTPKVKISKTTLYSTIFLGVIFLILPLTFPKFFFPLIWISLFFIFDPINYLRNEPNLMSYAWNKKIKIFILLSIAVLITGFFWEFWNFYAVIKWKYVVPFVGFFKIFEMPILGYLGYIPFSFQLYSIYHFIKSLF